MLADAINLAFNAHLGQLRKSGEPFIMHPLRVIDQLIKWQYINENDLCAAVLHDTIEDTSVTFEEIKNLTSLYVANIVLELTNVYTKQKYPILNREERKILEFQRIAKCSEMAKIIKCADRIDNTKSTNEKELYNKENELFRSLVSCAYENYIPIL